MSVTLNKTAESYAKSLIGQGKYTTKSGWSISADDENEMLRDDDWKGYSKWFLGQDSDEPADTKGHWKYPVGKGGQVYRSALIAIRSRAGQQGVAAIGDAAGRLIEAIDKKEGKEEKAMPGLEYRSVGEVRAISDSEEGVFEGYAVTWDFTDAYNSTFKRGAFRRTLKERKGKIKVLDNHDEDALIGKVLEAKEDDTGLWVRAQLNLELQRAKDVYSNLKRGFLDTLSFGFRSAKDGLEKGVRIISDLDLYEVSPVPFPASERAIITEVRKRTAAMLLDTESRATDFGQTFSDSDLRRRGEYILAALETTLFDVWYAPPNVDPLPLIDSALTDFHGAYMEWAAAFVARFRSGDQSMAARALPESERANVLAQAMREHLAAASLTPESLAADSPFTVAEVRTLLAGRTTLSRDKLAALPEVVAAAHRVVRNAQVETLCADLRAGLSDAERQRLGALLGLTYEPSPESLTEEPTLAWLAEFRRGLGTANAQS